MTLEEWLKSLVNMYREIYNKLSLEERQYLSNLDNLSPPLQIEILLITEDNKDLQLIIFTHDVQLEDMLIEISGPYNIETEFKKIKSFIHKNRFIKLFENRLEKECIEKIKGLRHYRKSKIISKTLLGPKGENYFLWSWYGKIQEVDIKFMKDNIFNVNPNKLKRVDEDSKKYFQIIKNSIRSQGTYFYPPIWIGEVPKIELLDKIKEDHHLWLRNYVKQQIYTEYKERKVIVESDGYFVIGENDAQVAKHLFNEIMSIILLYKGRVFTVNEFDLAPTFIHPETESIIQHSSTRRGIKLSEERIKPISKYFHKDRMFFTKSEFLLFINKAENITSNSKISMILRTLLESYTHLMDKELNQSFIMSWTIIEQYLGIKLDQVLQTKDISEKRKKRIKNFTAEMITELLNLKQIISDNAYNKINKFRTKRNRYMHNLDPIDVKTAKESYFFSRNLVLEIVKELI